MKFSEAMLKGFEMVGGKQCRGTYTEWDIYLRPVAHCALGAAIAGGWKGADAGVQRAWGICVAELNDKGMPWEHIYGMAVAADL